MVKVHAHLWVNPDKVQAVQLRKEVVAIELCHDIRYTVAPDLGAGETLKSLENSIINALQNS